MLKRNCIEWATESYQECAEYRDEGYSKCSKWDSKCSKWSKWFRWLCKALTWFCVAWYWVSNIVCVVWTTIVTAVCIAWEIIVIVLTPIVILIEIILSIPIIGRILREIISVLTEVIFRIVGIVDVILDLFGIVFPKKMRVSIVILKDEKGNPTTTEAVLQPHIDKAKQIYNDGARIQLIIQGINTVGTPSPSNMLDVECGAGAWGEDLLLTGSNFEINSIKSKYGAFSRLVGYGSPILVYIVRSVDEIGGCSLGPLSNYVTVKGSNPICFAHEISHALGLWHVDEVNNLANPSCGGEKIKKWQRIIIRNSRFVTYV